MKLHIICDLDGTLADDYERSKRFLNQPCPMWIDPIKEVHNECSVCNGKGLVHRWEEYFQACHEDKVNHAVLSILHYMHRHGAFHVTILTGRCETVRAKTLEWLRSYDVRWDELVMRPKDNRVDDHILKIGFAKNMGLTPENTLFVLEDRQRVVDAWRREGYTCLQVAPGNF